MSDGRQSDYDTAKKGVKRGSKSHNLGPRQGLTEYCGGERYILTRFCSKKERFWGMEMDAFMADAGHETKPRDQIQDSDHTQQNSCWFLAGGKPQCDWWHL